jgi:hypothetical protein
LRSGEPVEWERADGICEFRLVRGRALTEPGYALKRMAIEKMIGVEMISAEFGGTYRLFEHRASVALDLGMAVRFFGAYESKEPESQVAEMTPRFCLRWSKYDRIADYAAFGRAVDKHAYVTRGQVLSSSIRFYTGVDVEAVGASIQRAAGIVHAGISFQKTGRSHPAVGGAWIILDVAEPSCQFFYVPTGVCSNALDSWLDEWQESFATIANRPGIAPDGGMIHVSYRSSIFDWLERVTGSQSVTV